MKNLSIALFALLFIATGFLFFLEFNGKKGKNVTSGSGQANVQTEGIAFVNIDSVIYNFELFFDRRAELLEKQKKAEAELNSKGSQYEKNARDFEEKVSKVLVTRAQAEQMQQGLLQQQQELVTLRDNLQANLMEEEQVMNRQIVDYITTYLDEHKSEFNFQYILGKSFGSPILYGDPGLDITSRVVEALNVQYREEKKK